MTRATRTEFLARAEQDLRLFFPSREQAAVLLESYAYRAGLDGDMRADLLARFEPAEPVMVAGRDYLPALPPVVEHYEIAAYSGGMLPPWVDCSCGETFNAGTSALAYAAFDAHRTDELAKATPAGDPRVYLPLAAERFQ